MICKHPYILTNSSGSHCRDCGSVLHVDPKTRVYVTGPDEDHGKSIFDIIEERDALRAQLAAERQKLDAVAAILRDVIKARFWHGDDGETLAKAIEDSLAAAEWREA